MIDGRSARPVPVDELAGGAELARPLHRDVDLRVQVPERPVHRLGPLGGGHPEDVVLVVVRDEELHVARVLVVPLGLEPLDLRESLRVHRRHQDVPRVGVVGRDARHHVGDDEPAQVLLVLQRVLDGEDAAPRLARAERSSRWSRPSAARTCSTSSTNRGISHRAGVVGLVAVVGAELVVVVVLDAGAGEPAVARLEVLVGDARPAVEKEDLHARVVPHPLRPDAEGPGRAFRPGSSGRRR